jgi:hypothetical protein
MVCIILNGRHSVQAVELERLAIYHNPNSVPWKVPSNWEAMSPAEWSEVRLECNTLPSVSGRLAVFRTIPLVKPEICYLTAYIAILPRLST